MQDIHYNNNKTQPQQDWKNVDCRKKDAKPVTFIYQETQVWYIQRAHTELELF